jgi:hypothetical protein
VAGLLAGIAGLASALLLPPLVSPSAAAEPGSISGYAWLDTDADGIREEGEAPAVDVDIRLLRCSDGFWVDFYSTRTDENGHYTVRDIEPNAEGYCIEFNLRYFNLDATFSPQHAAGSTAETDSDVDLATLEGIPLAGLSQPVPIAAGEQVTTIGAGVLPGEGDPNAGSIGGYAWLDEDVDGMFCNCDPPVEGLPVRLMQGETVLDETVTSGLGWYRFVDVPAGDHHVEFDLVGRPSGTTFAGPAGSSSVDPDTIVGDPPRGRTFVQHVEPRRSRHPDVGVVNPTTNPLVRSIGGVVWRDLDNDSIRQGAEPRVPGVTVRLIRNHDGALIGTRTTGNLGGYSFGGFGQDWYHVEFELTGLPGGATFVTPYQAYNRDTDSDVRLNDVTGSPARGRTQSIFVRPGDNFQNIGAGVRY